MLKELKRIGETGNCNTPSISHPTNATGLCPRLDWLSMNFEAVNINQLLEYLEHKLILYFDYDNIKSVKQRRENWIYLNGSRGSTIGLECGDSNSTGNARLCLSGEMFGHWSDGHMRSTITELITRFKGVATRVDICVDDYERALNFSDIQDAIRKGNFALFSKSRYMESYGGKTAGKTMYLGARKSNKFGRIYDRMGVTNGEQNCIRFEVEYKGGAALQIGKKYIEGTLDESRIYLSGLMKGAFDFIIRKDKNLDRGTRLGWWQSFLDRIQGQAIHLSYPKKKTSIDKTLKWIERGVSKSLLIMERALGIDKAIETLTLWKNEAAKRLSSLDRSNILVFQTENIPYPLPVP